MTEEKNGVPSGMFSKEFAMKQTVRLIFKIIQTADKNEDFNIMLHDAAIGHDKYAEKAIEGMVEWALDIDEEEMTTIAF